MKKVFWPAMAIATAVVVGASGAYAQIKVGVAGPLTGPNAVEQRQDRGLRPHGRRESLQCPVEVIRLDRKSVV